jgi:hypothetical protein
MITSTQQNQRKGKCTIHLNNFSIHGYNFSEFIIRLTLLPHQLAHAQVVSHQAVVVVVRLLSSCIFTKLN